MPVVVVVVMVMVGSVCGCSTPSCVIDGDRLSSCDCALRTHSCSRGLGWVGDHAGAAVEEHVGAVIQLLHGTPGAGIGGSSTGAGCP